jgi:hypothetical protein
MLVVFKERHLCRFPQCLQMLNHLDDPKFRSAIKRKDIENAIGWQQHRFFNHYRNNRLQQAVESISKESKDELMAEHVG